MNHVAKMSFPTFLNISPMSHCMHLIRNSRFFSFQGPTLVKQVSKLVNSNLPHIEPGRSLLLSSNRPADKRSPPTASTHQTFIDHCYFSQTPTKSRTPRGLLTPNETR